MKTALKYPVPNQAAIAHEYEAFILEKKHPCVMAKTVFLTENYHLNVYNTMDNDSKNILRDIARFIDQYDFESNAFESFIAVFPNAYFNTEQDFENALWNTLQSLHNEDDSPWDPSVSSDPNDSNFSFSLKGKAFYIVGLHPKSSRLARQSPYPTIVFNLHEQFEKLREMGSYKKVKKRIRKRDKKLQGHINPVLKDFGKDSETKQYSGRHVNDQWTCPFHSKS